MTTEQSGYLPQVRPTPWPWSGDFLKWEMAPYPGRFSTVVRMVVAATLVMVIVMTFRLPGAALAGYYALFLVSENLTATWRGAVSIVLGFVVGTAYTLLGMMLFRGYSPTYVFWVVGTLYLVFFLMRTTTNYGAAAGFGFLIGSTLPIWDQPLTSDAQVTGTLWQTWTVAVAAGITVLTEAVYRICDQSDPLIRSIDDLLFASQRVLESLAEGGAIPELARNKVVQYDMTGTGRLRTSLLRQGVDSTRRAYLSALISLGGRLVELTAELQRSSPSPQDEEAGRLRIISQKLEQVRTALRVSGSISASSAVEVFAAKPSASIPILSEIERTVELIHAIFHRGESTGAISPEQVPAWHGFFVPDAFENPEYQRFAFAGCMAASFCFVLYNALDWPGINTSVLTCIITALSTIGTSVQKLILRLAGYITGTLIIGIPAQVLILPYLDISGFTLFFAVVTAFAAWFATSSPRLSYFGMQIALSFYFINLVEFHVQTNLTIPRDTVIGILLGTVAMGLMFERFGTKSDMEEVRKQFSQILRMLASLAFRLSWRDRTAMLEVRRLRSQINDSFVNLAAQMDTVPFELRYRRSNERDLMDCRSMQRTQPLLRWIYVLEQSLPLYRGWTEAEFTLTPPQDEVLNLFLHEYGNSLTNFAASHEPHTAFSSIAGLEQRLRQVFQEHISPSSTAVLDICERMVVALHALREARFTS